MGYGSRFIDRNVKKMNIDFSTLGNYGILGLWTLTLLYEKAVIHRQFRRAIEDNTRALELLESKLSRLR